jgi:hypothetical protein
MLGNPSWLLTLVLFLGLVQTYPQITTTIQVDGRITTDPNNSFCLLWIGKHRIKIDRRSVTFEELIFSTRILSPLSHDSRSLKWDGRPKFRSLRYHNSGGRKDQVYRNPRLITVIPLCDKCDRGTWPMRTHTHRFHGNTKVLGSPKEGPREQST